MFLVPGMVAMSVLFTSVFSCIQIIWDKQFGFLKETLIAPVSRIEIMFGMTVGGATTAVFQGIILMVLAVLLGLRITNPGRVFYRAWLYDPCRHLLYGIRDIDCFPYGGYDRLPAHHELRCLPPLWPFGSPVSHQFPTWVA